MLIQIDGPITVMIPDAGDALQPLLTPLQSGDTITYAVET
jgi:hypothetical protein